MSSVPCSQPDWWLRVPTIRVCYHPARRRRRTDDATGPRLTCQACGDTRRITPSFYWPPTSSRS